MGGKCFESKLSMAKEIVKNPSTQRYNFARKLFVDLFTKSATKKTVVAQLSGMEGVEPQKVAKQAHNFANKMEKIEHPNLTARQLTRRLSDLRWVGEVFVQKAKSMKTLVPVLIVGFLAWQTGLLDKVAAIFKPQQN